jgi:hypothetical protein
MGKWWWLEDHHITEDNIPNVYYTHWKKDTSHNSGQKTKTKINIKNKETKKERKKLRPGYP